MAEAQPLFVADDVPSADLQSPPAQPLAEPILASFLLEGRLRMPGNGERVPINGGAAGKGLDLDQYVLCGGIEKGEVVGVSSAGEVGKLLALHLVTTFVLAHPTRQVSIIDTTGHFLVSSLASVIRFRLAASGGDLDHTCKTYDEKTMELLSRVSITRVFDIEGVCEVVSEISAYWRDWTRRSENWHETVDESEEKGIGRSKETLAGFQRKEVVELSDSEDEDDDDEGGGLGVYKKDERPSGSQKRQIGPIELMVVDDMTTPISGLFSQRERGSAHDLLAALSRNLNSLSEQCNILTILLNDATMISPNDSEKSHSEYYTECNIYPPNPNSNLNRKSSKNPTSIFMATTSRPALGRLFSDLVTLHLFITSVPKTQADAEILYAATKAQREETIENISVSKVQDKAEYAFVLEVLKDEISDLESWSLETTKGVTELAKVERGRTGSRVQRWGAFVIVGEFGIQDAFPSEASAVNTSAVSTGGSRYIDGTAVHVLKQFPMGRRA